MGAYETALASGSTALARCFKLTRRDGAVMGFTDHDRDLAWGGTLFRSRAALSASEAAATLGLSADELDATGALSDDAISEADLAAGLYDGAEVEIWDVDWRAPSTRGLLGRYSVGQVERGALAFRVELRSLAAQLDRIEGRVHTTLCDAEFGDGRCGASLAVAGRRAVATVIAVNGLDLTVSGLDGYAAGQFSRGSLQFDTGANAGERTDLRAHLGAGGSAVLALWRPLPRPVAAGDTLTVTVGCDKTYATCTDRFANGANFRGFPHMPSESFAGEYAVQGYSAQDGGSRLG